MRDTQEGESIARMTLSKMNFGPLPMVNHFSRLAVRFYGDDAQIEGLRSRIGAKLSAREALDAGLVTAAPDDLYSQDEIPQTIDTLAPHSPAPLTLPHTNLRF